MDQALALSDVDGGATGRVRSDPMIPVLYRDNLSKFAHNNDKSDCCTDSLPCTTGVGEGDKNN